VSSQITLPPLNSALIEQWRAPPRGLPHAAPGSPGADGGKSSAP